MHTGVHGGADLWFIDAAILPRDVPTPSMLSPPPRPSVPEGQAPGPNPTDGAPRPEAFPTRASSPAVSVHFPVREHPSAPEEWPWA